MRRISIISSRLADLIVKVRRIRSTSVISSRLGDLIERRRRISASRIVKIIITIIMTITIIVKIK